jgi:hypothetical protein
MSSWRPLSKCFTPPLIELSPLLPSLDMLSAQRENDLVRIQAWDSSRKTVLMGYHELMLVYEGRCITFLSSVEKFCQQLVDRTRISKELLAAMVSSMDTDEMEAPENRKDDNEFLDEELVHEDLKTAEDEITPRDIHVSFFAAMERMEKDGLPPKQIYSFPQETKDKFIQWFNENLEHPYPSKEEKLRLAKETGTEISQVNSWFYHRRKRFRNLSIVQAIAEDFPSPCSADKSFEK